MGAVLPQKRVWTYYARRRLFWIGIFTAAVALLAWVAWEFSPDRQIRKCFQRLLQSAENRNWDKVRSLMASDYRDQWGFDREGTVEAGRQVLGHFFVLGIDPGKPDIQRKDNEATILAPLRLSGKGTGLAEAAMERVNSLQEPFRFAWRRETWHPWSWKLVSVEQPGLQFDASQIPSLP